MAGGFGTEFISIRDLLAFLSDQVEKLVSEIPSD